MAHYLAGASCGPVNTLKSVSARLDVDRSLQQDRFVSVPQQGVAGPSRQPQPIQRPVSSASSARRATTSPSPFDLAEFRQHLSQSPQPRPAFQPDVQSAKGKSAWAESFTALSIPASSQTRRIVHDRPAWGDEFSRHDEARAVAHQPSPHPGPGLAPWQRPMGISQYDSFARPPMYVHHQIPPAPIAFSVHDETARHVQPDQLAHAQAQAQAQAVSEPLSDSQEVLAQTATAFMDQLKVEENALMQEPKFANSQFMQLVSAIGDKRVVAEEGKPALDGGEVGQGATFVARAGSSASGWAGDFMAQMQPAASTSSAAQPSASATAPAASHPIHRTFGHYTSLQRAPGVLDDRLPLHASNQVTQSEWDKQFVDQEAILQTSLQPPTTRRKSVHFDQAMEPAPLGNGVPNSLEEAMAHSTSIPGSSAAWESVPDDAFDFDEEMFYGFNGPMQSVQSPRIGVADMEGWKAMDRDWAEYQQSMGMKPEERYLFQARNPYTSRLDMEHASPTLKGVLELEAEVQTDPSSWEAWYALGLKQQENEREEQAILALSKVIQLEPDHRDTYLALAVSYTNEGQKEAANTMLERWIDLAQDERRDGEMNGGSYEQRRARIIERLIDMARAHPDELDPDVQIALGVMFNASEEYEKAEDCFAAALSVRPDDWLLYNRLGATLANSGRSEQAIALYHQALSLHPNFVRALFNLGVSYVNLGRYAEAAQSVLDALRLQHADATEGYAAAQLQSISPKGITSGTLWNTLRSACLHMGRPDLVALVAKRDLSALPASLTTNEQKATGLDLQM